MRRKRTLSTSVMSNPKKGNYILASAFPWHSKAGLISWLDMEKFSAAGFYKIGSLLGNLFQALEATKHGLVPGFNGDQVYQWLQIIERECSGISLIQSAKCAKRICDDLKTSIATGDLKVRIKDFQSLLFSEIEDQLFLWIPVERSGFYEKTAEDLLGPDCTLHFPSILRDIEEAAKSYAVGRFTACAFHLMRVTEAAVRAFGTAIGSPIGTNPNWGEVFKEYDRQLSLPPKNRPPTWNTGGEFLEAIGGDLRAVKAAWRNPTMHLDEAYDEEDAKKLLVVIPALMRHLASKLDEKGIYH